MDFQKYNIKEKKKIKMLARKITRANLRLLERKDKRSKVQLPKTIS